MPTPAAYRSPSDAPTLANCPLCRDERLVGHFRKASEGIVRCTGCGLVFRNPQPSDASLAAIYTDSYFFGTGEGTSGDRYEQVFAGLKRATAAAYLSRIELYQGWSAESRRGLKLFEIGPGLGDLLVVAASRGYDVAGVEYSPSSVARANAKLQKPCVRQGTITDVADLNGTMDVCVLSDVIEHTRDPLQVLGAARRLLKPGGVVFVATPSLDSWSARLLGDRWMEIKDEHLFFFDRATLESALSRAGFVELRLEPGRKTLSPEYICRHFDRFPVPGLTPLARVAARLVPGPLLRKRIRVVASGVDALGRRSFERPIDERPAKLSVVLPVYNEKSTFTELIDQVLAKEIAGVEIEIVIVESGSTDGTRDDVARVAEHRRVKVVWQDKPKGKGYAVRAGFEAATGDFILIQDADLEYDVGDYDQLLAPLRTFQRAFVLGIRHGKDGHTWKVRHFTDRVLLGQWMNVGHLVFTTLFNLVYGQRLTDPFTMYKVFRRECLSGLRFEANRFDFDWELAGKLVRCGYVPLELPVNYQSRSFAEGKKVTLIRDPLTWIRACFKYRFVPLKDRGVRIKAR